jgi:energy-coupling factor transport system substrate-specific component
MSWQVGAFAVLALALAGGFAWYERARPSARLVALVGTLAAFAALGRIAFAALPNVKPTTDIVLIAGYALGGAPGFVVGALAGLTSNFFFGQGPWTPWQMAAWGLTGMLGAGLAIATGRRLGRWPMALFCAAAGFAFAAVQDVGDWVTYSDHSVAALGIYVGKGIGFDVIHAAGCLAFALAFGPALARALERFALRLEVTWHDPPVPTARAGILPALVLAVILAQGVGLGAPGDARAASVSGYLLAAQNSDGGFGPAPGAGSTGLETGWAALGLAAEGHNPQDVVRGGHSALDYVRAAGWAGDVGALERTILVVRAAGLPATSFGGKDLLSALRRQIRGDGSVADQVNLTAFAVLALRAAGAAPAGRTLSWLVRQQNGDGGFSFATGGSTSDVDDTGAVLEALAGSAGAAERARSRAVKFVRAQQDGDGGFAAQPGGESNAQSTAWAVQGLVAAGVDPSSLHRGGAPSPLQFIGSLVASDGHVAYAHSSDQTPVWVTGEAALALAGRPLPLPPVAAAQPAPVAPARARVAVRAPAHRRARHIVHRAAAVRRRTIRSTAMLQLAADAGVATALVLAPVGIG